MSSSGYFSNFYFLVVFVLATELSYGWWQEIVYGVYKFKYAWFSTFIQCISYIIFSSIQSIIQRGHLPKYNRKTFPHLGHFMIGSVSLIGRVTGNMAFRYMDYGLKVLFTSANPILVLATGIFYKQSYSLVQYLSTSMLAAGLVLFSYVDYKNPDGNFSFFGVGLMIFSVCMEALKMRTHELVMKKYKSPEVDATFWSSVFGAICSIVIVILTGQLAPSLAFFCDQPLAFVSMMLIFVFGYTSLIASLYLINVADVFVSSIVSTTRKALTIFISFAAFSKQVTFHHIIAIALFFGGILWQTAAKQKKAKKVQ